MTTVHRPNPDLVPDLLNPYQDERPDFFEPGHYLVITKGATISGLPKAFKIFGQGEISGIRVSLIIFAVLALIIGYALKNHRYLQQDYFIGGNRRSARMSGIKVERFIVFDAQDVPR